MSTMSLDPLLYRRHKHSDYPNAPTLPAHYRNGPPVSIRHTSRSYKSRILRPHRGFSVRASGGADTSLVERPDAADVALKETFMVKRSEKAEGKISIILDNEKEKGSWQLTVGCNLPGKWILHWGVNYVNDLSSDWDQPPIEMRPPGSVPIKDYAIETPMTKSVSVIEENVCYEVKIDITADKNIAAINFVLKDEETGSWYQHRGRDFKVALIDQLQKDGSTVAGAKMGSNLWPGALGQLSSMLLKSEGETGNSNMTDQQKKRLKGFYEEQFIVKEVLKDSLISVSVKNCPETSNYQVYIDTDIPGDIVVHWGVCKDGNKEWDIPAEPYPDETIVFKKNALRTLLKKKEGEQDNCSLFTLNKRYAGFSFVLKIDENTWLNNNGKDFYIPLSSSTSSPMQPEKSEENAYTDGIINEIRNLVSDISSEKSRKTKTKEAQESILQEIEKLAAEAYSIFRTSIPTFSEDILLETEEVETPVKISSGTGSGFEILCQGFNWESHKSGKWYMELIEKADELSSLGFTVVWLPPPTDSVSPEGYMPRDLYNLNSRYGNIDQLKRLVKRYHEVGIKVLGDVVLNHRCAQHKNNNGIWNIFGGRLNWDDRAIVADDPHFQGRGNKSSGDNFHAAPNIDHSQDFVRKDIKEWLCWLREEIGYDGWRLDFARGFWGGYVKDYMGASEPYFAVGEYWDSLSYSYGEMDHNQDAHRQRIVDWINATSGTAGAFDVTTKGILHTALEKCEYWRLSDEKGKPPGVVGWWPSRAVTFIENHDTGSTQGHWRFPGGKEMQGYAYILTHPGTPAIFYDHIFSHMRSEISSLISLRNRNKIQCRSIVKITKAERDVYAAVIDEKVAMKIGPGHYEPPSGPKKWSLTLQGNDYKVWEIVM